MHFASSMKLYAKRLYAFCIEYAKSVNVQYIGAWKRGPLVFKLQALGAVLEAIEASYGVDIRLDVSLMLTDRFTGTLPVDDLSLALRIIGETYHLQYQVQGDKVVMMQQNR